jgi:hypothetical protein
MGSSSVKVQIAEASAPSIPPWFAEVAVVAQVLTQVGVLNAIEERVRFARARFGVYEVIDFAAVLIGYAVSGEPTLEAFYARLFPFSDAFMALFQRTALPHPSTLSRFLSAIDQVCVEALRTVFQEDLVARAHTTSLPGGLWDRRGNHWIIIDVDGTKQTARQRSLLRLEEFPAPHRRLDKVCAPGYFGDKRGEVGRTRTTVLQAHTHQWLGTYSGAGNGQYQEELKQALQAISAYLTAFSIPFSQVLVRLDGLYGNRVVITEVLKHLMGIVVRCKDYALLDLPAVQTRLQAPPDQQVTHPETGTSRMLFDCPDLLLTPSGPRVRLIVATHPTLSTKKPPVGVLRAGTVYELFLTTAPPGAFIAPDVLGLYLHRGSFETVLSDEDQEQDTDRWVSHTPCGQEWWQIFNQWVWNLRLELGQHLETSAMRLTEFAPAHVGEPPGEIACSRLTAPPAPPEPSSETTLAQFGPPQWARAAQMGGFAGSAFVPQPDGTLRCPRNHPLFPQERRPERDGSLRVVYAAGIRSCRPCPLRDHCLGYGMTTKRPRRVSAVLWPLSCLSPSLENPAGASGDMSSMTASYPLLWGDWERCQIRRRWIRLLRTQTVTVTTTATPIKETIPTREATVLTRAQRAHYRLSWAQRLARNARPLTAPPQEVTVHGLSASFAQSFGFSVVVPKV